MKNQFKNNSLSPYLRKTHILENFKSESEVRRNTIMIKKIQSRKVIPDNFYKPITKIINFDEFE